MSFVPAFAATGDPAAPPERTAFILHGIFGSARNWKTFSALLAARCPAWRFVAVDLRNHGRSRGAPPPHPLAACAADLAALGARFGGPPAALIGHSFGGKVALAYARAHPAALRQLWLLDSPPGSGPAGGMKPSESEAGRVLAAMKSVALPVARRSEVADLIHARGVARAVASWMATNLEPAPGGGYTWPYDVAALEEMIEDYWRQDFWADLASLPASSEVHDVRAAESDRWTPVDLARIAKLAEAGRIRSHVLPAAGHWLHADNPAGLLDLLAPHFGG